MSESEVKNNFIDHISKSLNKIFKNLIDGNAKLAQAINEARDVSNYSNITRAKLLSFQTKIDSLLQIYRIENGEFSDREKSTDISKELGGLIGKIIGSSKGLVKRIEYNPASDIPVLIINTDLFLKWMNWCVLSMFRNDNVSQININIQLLESEVLIEILPKLSVKTKRVEFDEFYYRIAKQYFVSENGSLRIDGNSGLEIKLPTNGSDEVLSGSEVDSQAILKKVREEIDLPTLSPIATKVISLASDANSSAQEIAKIITLDPALTSRILKVVNSPFYGFQKKISTLSQAVAILGMKAVRTLSLCISIVDSFPKKGSTGIDLSEYWERALTSALTCKLTAEKLGLKIGEEAFIAGLTQNLGCLIFDKLVPDVYGAVYQKHLGNSDELVKSEKELWGLDHAVLGYEVFNHWKMPTDLSEPILNHHKFDEIDPKNKKLLALAKLINLSDTAANVINNDTNTRLNIQKLKDKAESYFKLSGKDVDEIMGSVTQEFEDVAKEFDFKVKKHVDYTEIIQKANSELGKINLDYEQINRELTQAKEKAENLTSELRVAYKKLEDKAVRDGLTNLFNHGYFFELITKEFTNSKKNKLTLSCIMMDLDNFKKVNDTYGHQEGDTVLKDIGEILLDAIREGDVAARYGGEEFTIILPDTATSEAQAVAERIRAAVEEHLFTENLLPGSITVSIGVAGLDQKVVKKAPDLVEMADKAVYHSKHNGKNMVTLYTKDLD